MFLFKPLLALIGSLAVASSYQLPGAYERMWLYYAYRLEHLTTKSNFKIAAQCNKCGTSEGLIQHLAGNKKLPAELERSIKRLGTSLPDVEEWAVLLHNNGVNDFVDYKTVLTFTTGEERSFAVFLEKVASVVKGKLQAGPLEGVDELEYKNVRSRSWQAMEKVYESRKEAALAFPSKKYEGPLKGLKPVFKRGSIGVDYAASAAQNPGTTADQWRSAWENHYKNGHVNNLKALEKIQKEIRPVIVQALQDDFNPLRTLENPNPTTRFEFKQGDDLLIDLEATLEANPELKTKLKMDREKLWKAWVEHLDEEGFQSVAKSNKLVEKADTAWAKGFKIEEHPTLEFVRKGKTGIGFKPGQGDPPISESELQKAWRAHKNKFDCAARKRRRRDLGACGPISSLFEETTADAPLPAAPGEGKPGNGGSNKKPTKGPTEGPSGSQTKEPTKGLPGLKKPAGKELELAIKTSEKEFEGLVTKSGLTTVIKQKWKMPSVADLRAKWLGYAPLTPKSPQLIKGSKVPKKLGGGLLAAAGVGLYLTDVVTTWRSGADDLKKTVALTSIIPFVGCATQLLDQIREDKVDVFDSVLCVLGDALLLTPAWPVGLAIQISRAIINYFDEPKKQAPSAEAWLETRDANWKAFLGDHVYSYIYSHEQRFPDQSSFRDKLNSSLVIETLTVFSEGAQSVGGIEAQAQAALTAAGSDADKKNKIGLENEAAKKTVMAAMPHEVGRKQRSLLAGLPRKFLDDMDLSLRKMADDFNKEFATMMTSDKTKQEYPNAEAHAKLKTAADQIAKAPLPMPDLFSVAFVMGQSKGLAGIEASALSPRAYIEDLVPELSPRYVDILAVQRTVKVAQLLLGKIGQDKLPSQLPNGFKPQFGDDNEKLHVLIAMKLGRLAEESKLESAAAEARSSKSQQPLPTKQPAKGKGGANHHHPLTGPQFLPIGEKADSASAIAVALGLAKAFTEVALSDVNRQFLDTKSDRITAAIAQLALQFQKPSYFTNILYIAQKFGKLTPPAGKDGTTSKGSAAGPRTGFYDDDKKHVMKLGRTGPNSLPF
ncbi:hypothetical protein AAL_03278 [Moelleriella libera RCEF 2490]|uniref:Heat-labile enterotoxin, A chain n=1 Tax=Moelleriella libera RCEF 2490 TaxID=1081109 RepID=A0A168D3J5_9HYPO|nr:hypothetical protein AAL_03278 [Moelleriella libera RCEF 2490]